MSVCPGAMMERTIMAATLAFLSFLVKLVMDAIEERVNVEYTIGSLPCMSLILFLFYCDL